MNSALFPHPYVSNPNSHALESQILLVRTYNAYNSKNIMFTDLQWNYSMHFEPEAVIRLYREYTVWGDAQLLYLSLLSLEVFSGGTSFSFSCLRRVSMMSNCHCFTCSTAVIPSCNTVHSVSLLRGVIALSYEPQHVSFLHMQSISL